jgi:hypothetical protein
MTRAGQRSAHEGVPLPGVGRGQVFQIWKLEI